MSGSAPSLAHAVYTAEDLLVDVLVVDHDEAYGAEALRHAAQRFPVLLLTSGQIASTLEQVCGTGIEAAVRKRDAASVLLRSIEGLFLDLDRRRGRSRSFALGHQADTPGNNPEQARVGSLTARERQLILVLTCNASAPGKVIASRLRISEHTLRNHLTSIYAKLGVQNRLSLHAYAAVHHLDRQDGPCARARTRSSSDGRVGRSSYGAPSAPAVGFERPVAINSSPIVLVPPVHNACWPE